MGLWFGFCRAWVWGFWKRGFLVIMQGFLLNNIKFLGLDTISFRYIAFGFVVYNK